MNAIELKNLFSPKKIKDIYERITDIDPDTEEFKTVRGKLLLIADGQLNDQILWNDPKRKIFSQTFKKQIEAIIGRAVYEDQKAIALLQEQLYINKEISLKLLDDLEKLLRIDCGEKGEFSYRRMKLQKDEGLKRYLEKMSFTDIEKKVIELIGDKRAKEKTIILQLQKNLRENDWLENNEQDEKKFQVGLGLFYFKHTDRICLCIMIEHEYKRNNKGGKWEAYGLTNNKDIIANIILEDGDYESDITQAFDLEGEEEY